MPSSPKSAENRDFVAFFWSQFVLMIPVTINNGHKAQQFFEIALVVFRSTDQSTRKDLPLANYVIEWSILVLQHTHHEVCYDDTTDLQLAEEIQFVGRGGVDHVVFGLAALLHWCIQLSKSSNELITAR